MTRRAVQAAWLVAAFAAAAGCSPYTVRGKVIQGDVSFVAVVEDSDPRLVGPGLSGASVELWTDPEKLNRKRVAVQTSDSNGDFAMPFSETGAGLLQYDVGVVARRDGYSGAETNIGLPSSSKRLLIMMKPGASRVPKETETLLEQYRRYNR